MIEDGEKSLKASERMEAVVRGLTAELETVPGWREWCRAKIGYLLNLDDPFYDETRIAKELVLPDHLEGRRRLVMAYLEMDQSIRTLRDVEFYFRRYPFRGAVVSHRQHLVYICEMYFSRFYQIRERMKKTLGYANSIIGNKKIDVGSYIKRFDKSFEEELRERNLIHHHEGFDDAELGLLFLSEVSIIANNGYSSAEDMRKDYRRISRRWAMRVRRQADLVDVFLEDVAQAIVEHCALPGASPTEVADAVTRAEECGVHRD